MTDTRHSTNADAVCCRILEAVTAAAPAPRPAG
jgi:hypothetical protein